jgi:hypothetical protein
VVGCCQRANLFLLFLQNVILTDLSLTVIYVAYWHRHSDALLWFPSGERFYWQAVVNHLLGHRA